jgi:hypothetical protein
MSLRLGEVQITAKGGRAIAQPYRAPNHTSMKDEADALSATEAPAFVYRRIGRG